MSQGPPRLITAQTAGCAPLARAWKRLDGGSLKEAVRRRSRYMSPWERAPASLAHGILDDETYDWFEIVKAMRSADVREKCAAIGFDVVANSQADFLAYNKKEVDKWHKVIVDAKIPQVQ